VHDGGAAVILDHDDLHAVVEKELGDVLRRLRRGRQDKRCDSVKAQATVAIGAAFEPSG
jgi:hypothetical protein